MMINKRLINICNESKKYIALTVLTNWIATLCNIITVIFIGQFINKLFLYKNLNLKNENVMDFLSKFEVFKNISLTTSIIIVAGLLVLRYISNILYTKFSCMASSKARVTLRELIYKKLLELGTSYTSVESTSSVVQVSVEGVEQLEIYFGRYLPQFFYALLVPVTLFFFMSFISIKASVVFILSVPLIPISIIAIMKIAKRILKDYWKSYSDLGGTFLENLQGLTTLKVFNIDEERHEKMNNEAENFRKITMKVLSMQLNSITIMDLVAFCGAALGIIVALFQFRNGEIQIGSLIIIAILSSEFFIPLRLLGSYFHIAMNGMAASDRMFKILDANVDDITELEENEVVTKASGHDVTFKEKSDEVISEMKLNKNIIKENKIFKDVRIKLKDVSFSYDGKRNVLNNINMDISNGGVVAIVGESGSGKSTIASLILNEHKVSSGEILINNTSIEKVNRDSIYKNLALVSTNSHIFNGTILDNLLIGKKDATDKEIENALKLGRLYDFVSGLKDGLLTDVGQAGSSLSGGQKQRLALARAILADRQMIIFDEATSNIDVESEESIWEAIYELSKSKTILVISHRLLNVKDAEKIYVLNKGKLEESGKHQDLINKKGIYYNMVNSQNELEKIREVC